MDSSQLSRREYLRARGSWLSGAPRNDAACGPWQTPCSGTCGNRLSVVMMDNSECGFLLACRREACCD